MLDFGVTVTSALVTPPTCLLACHIADSIFLIASLHCRKETALLALTCLLEKHSNTMENYPEETKPLPQWAEHCNRAAAADRTWY